MNNNFQNKKMCQSANTMQDEVTTTRLHASKLAHFIY